MFPVTFLVQVWLDRGVSLVMQAGVFSLLKYDCTFITRKFANDQ